MYIATVQSKTVEPNGVVAVNVTFTNGTKSIAETVRPSDMGGFNYWVRSRLTALNSVPDILAALPDGKVVDGIEVIQPDTQTPDEVANQSYQLSRLKLIQLKQDIELGLATQDQYDAERTKAITAQIATMVVPEVIK